MARIPRDLGSPFNPNDPIELAEFEGFFSDVPNTRGLIAAARENPTRAGLLNPENATANRIRAANLFSDGFLPVIAATGGEAGDEFPTPDRVEPNQFFFRSGRARTVDIFPPGDVQANNDVRVWSFHGTNGFEGEDVEPPERWPAPTIRVPEGAIVHTLMSNSHGVHTIHHHGIEPTPVNDGVGHLTMEVGGDLGGDGDEDVGGEGGEYHYQWKAAEAGTYFYHCHRNTVLHFELGMYGPLIIDTPRPQILPPDAPADAPEAPYADGGPGFTLVGNAPTYYHTETFWVVDDIDVRWHGFGGQHLHRSAGIPDPEVDEDGNPVFMLANDPENPHFNDFLNSEYFFVVTGVTVGNGENGTVHGVLDNPIDPDEEDPLDSPRIKDNESLGALYNFIRPIYNPGEKLLIRALNASYCTTVWRFPASVDGTVIAADARTLGRAGFGSYSQPFRLSELPQDANGFRFFTLTTAQRWDILIDSVDPLAGDTDGEPGFREHRVIVEYHHWLGDADVNTSRVLQSVFLPIRVPIPG
ncbi:multicopper oxidase domain-containing protein [Geoalkalibacter halelectricus]|uniref:Multicopper oxidase domain-containing protein n=1 Tax=Geoalkalibacter halelectricus TaxID=2847045 RepID=A0ABY5ZMJ2_9BACT|nr:multicopper oxidase domain-containing protein [Geoalkalibacter halelectricus]MDO3378357.1 multicopper oxidase domain-containing protein [Geoalkalibacter halelectricus]UWZ80323.1 multicopper oxidase domain-containing protein [Geoalkalibacter halelectricus]